VTGPRPFDPLVARFGAAVVVTGPKPVDLLDGLLRAVRQLERGHAAVENQYERAVRPDGNPQALATIESVFEPADAVWRGLGVVPGSALRLRERYRRFDASARYPETTLNPLSTVSECRDGDVVAGRLTPVGCPAFGVRCTPTHPLGAAMVSAEGTCAAYFRFRRTADPSPVSGPVPALPAPVVPTG
jgi:hydrogenase expression/formation protein HypD